MAINNLTSLELALADWVARTDLTNAQLDLFINAAELEVLHGVYDMSGRVIVPPLRCKAMEVKNETYTLTGEYTALPAGFLGFRTVKLVANPNVTLTYVTPEVFNTTYLSTDTSADSGSYTIEAGQFRAGPGTVTGDVLSIIYHAAPDNLVALGSNWLCTQYPYVYLYGALRHLAVYLGMDERMMVFQSAFLSSLMALHASEKATQFSGSGLFARTLGVTVR